MPCWLDRFTDYQYLCCIYSRRRLPLPPGRALRLATLAYISLCNCGIYNSSGVSRHLRSALPLSRPQFSAVSLTLRSKVYNNTGRDGLSLVCLSLVKENLENRLEDNGESVLSEHMASKSASQCEKGPTSRFLQTKERAVP